MQIKFCDNLCVIDQGRVLRPIPSINGIEQSLSKLAGDTRLSSAARGKGWLRGTMRMQQCALGSLQGQGPAPGWGKAQNQGRLGDEWVHWEQCCRNRAGDTGRSKVRYYFLTKITVIISSCNRMLKFSVNKTASPRYSGKRYPYIPKCSI